MAVGKTRWILVFWMFVVAAVSYLDRNTISISGLMNMGDQIGGVITALLTSVLADRFGWTASFVFAAALLVVGVIAWLFVDPDKQLVAEDAPGAAMA